MTEAAFHQLVPEEPHVVPTVRVDAVWDDLVAAIETSPAKDRLFAMYAEREVAEGEHADRLRVQETVVAILNTCLRNGLFTPRISSGISYYKVPAEAFVPEFDSANRLPNADATTWSKGALHRIDTAAPFEWIAAGGYVLLLTEDEAGFIRERARDIIAQEERDQRRDARNRILDRAHRGEISAREAEAEAQRQGLDELESRPAPDKFDPRQRAAWTLPMTLAWIAWRSFEEVRQWDSEYRHECWDWTTSNSHPDGRRLTRRDAATVLEFEAMGYVRWSERESGRADRELDLGLPERTKSDLWRALQEGAVSAHGIPRNRQVRQKIPPIEWEDLEIHRDRATGREQFRYRHAPSELAYAGVRIPRAQVIACWPERASSDDASQPHTVGSETRAKAELMEIARKHVDEGAPAPVRAVWREECGLGVRPSGRVWQAVAEKYPQISSRRKPKRNRGA